MSNATKGAITLGVVLALGLALGLGIGWRLWRPKPAPVETAAPAVRQKDGSLELERKPLPAAEANKLVPLPIIPKGAVVERRVQVVVQPTASPTAALETPTSGAQPVPDRPAPAPVRVDLALVRMPDQTRRVIASSPDGQVIGGVDIPEAPPRPEPKVLRWAAGPSWNPADRTFGAWIDRDAGPLRLGVDLHQVRQPLAAGGGVTWAGMVRVGLRF